MANSDWIVQLEAVIDNSSLTNAQKKVAKEHFKADLDIQLDIDKFANQKKQIRKSINELASEMKTAFSKIDIELSDKQATSFAREFLGNIKQATKEQEKLNQAQKKSSLATQTKYYQRIIDNNKTIYSLKEKLLTADKKQESEIQRQIALLEKRNQYNSTQLSKKGLTDNSWEWEVNTSKEVLENRLRINQEKQKDIALSKQIADVNKIQLSTDITKIENDYKRFGIVSQEVENNLKELKIARENALKAEGTENASVAIENYNRKLAETKSSWQELQATQVSVNQRTSQMTEMQEWMRKNKNATKLCGDQVQKLIQECKTCDKVRFDQIKNEFKELQVEAGKAGKLGNTLFGGIIEEGKKFIQWTGVTGAIMAVSNNVREAVNELKDLDDILTEISKTSDLTERQLQKLGDTAFDTASTYGKKASDYLTGVQEMYRAGFDNASEMAELSILAQSAGDMEINSANDYLLATNAAYDFKGSVEELNKVLDSQNYITNNAAVSMQDMADATSEAASIASQYGVEIDQLSAMIAVIASKTRETGAEVGTALRSIFVTLQDTTSKPVVDAFNSVGISMTKFVNGTEQLKTPIELLKELSVAFNELPEGAIERSTILTDIGKKYHANTLSAILSDWSSYEQMLGLYNSSSADGSAFREAEKSANNLSGSLNKLSNTWTDTVENIVSSETLTDGVNVLNDLLSTINWVTDELGSLNIVGLSAFAFINKGKSKQRFCPAWG